MSANNPNNNLSSTAASTAAATAPAPFILTPQTGPMAFYSPEQIVQLCGDPSFRFHFIAPSADPDSTTTSAALVNFKTDTSLRDGAAIFGADLDAFTSAYKEFYAEFERAVQATPDIMLVRVATAHGERAFAVLLNAWAWGSGANAMAWYLAIWTSRFGSRTQDELGKLLYRVALKCRTKLQKTEAWKERKKRNGW